MDYSVRQTGLISNSLISFNIVVYDVEHIMKLYGVPD